MFPPVYNVTRLHIPEDNCHPIDRYGKLRAQLISLRFQNARF